MALSLGTDDTQSPILVSFLPLFTRSDEYIRGQLSTHPERGFVLSHGHWRSGSSLASLCGLVAFVSLLYLEVNIWDG